MAGNSRLRREGGAAEADYSRNRKDTLHKPTHRLRDAFAVHAVKLDDSGDGLWLLQEHLGHASFNTTAKYKKISGTEHRDWYDNLWHGDSQ